MNFGCTVFAGTADKTGIVTEIYRKGQRYGIGH